MKDFTEIWDLIESIIIPYQYSENAFNDGDRVMDSVRALVDGFHSEIDIPIKEVKGQPVYRPVVPVSLRAAILLAACFGETRKEYNARMSLQRFTFIRALHLDRELWQRYNPLAPFVWTEKDEREYTELVYGSDGVIPMFSFMSATSKHNALVKLREILLYTVQDGGDWIEMLDLQNLINGGELTNVRKIAGYKMPYTVELTDSDGSENSSSSTHPMSKCTLLRHVPDTNEFRCVVMKGDWNHPDNCMRHPCPLNKYVIKEK